MNSRQIMLLLALAQAQLDGQETIVKRLDMAYREELAREDAEKEQRVDRLAKWPGPPTLKAQNLPTGGQFAPPSM